MLSFRRLIRYALYASPVDMRLKAQWDASRRPQYLHGVLWAAEQAKRQGHAAVTVIEFGVAEGYGLLLMQDHAREAERHTGVRVFVLGFDGGTGIPKGTGDYRDHPDVWMPGDYPMDESALRAKLGARTRLIIGEVGDTVLAESMPAPIGFVAFDLDLYSSTVSALRILRRPDVQLLRRVALYFDDVDDVYNHRWAGALLAIREFNETSAAVKIDRWRGLSFSRPFPRATWLPRMYVAHDIAAINRVKLERQPTRRPLRP
jgi:hypothetical protein